jgi:putative ABC transport system ATP-binding protein
LVGTESDVHDEGQKNSPLIELINVKKQYLLGKIPVDALYGINLSIDPGEFIAILGPSGSGKSTMLNMIGALDKPSEGTVRIEGVDLTDLNEAELAEIRLKIGFVFQFFNLISRLNARENVELPMIIQGMSRNERRERAEQLLQTVGLGDRI